MSALGDLAGATLTRLNPYLLYVKVGVAVLVLASVGALYYRGEIARRDRDAARKERDEVLSVNAAQQAALARLEELRRNDAATVLRLKQDLEQINVVDRRSRARIVELERQNASVRDYLRGAVPPELQRVLAEVADEAAGDHP